MISNSLEQLRTLILECNNFKPYGTANFVFTDSMVAIKVTGDGNSISLNCDSIQEAVQKLQEIIASYKSISSAKSTEEDEVLWVITRD